MLIDERPGDLQEALRANLSSARAAITACAPQSEQAHTLEAMDVETEEASPKPAVESRLYNQAGSTQFVNLEADLRLLHQRLFLMVDFGFVFLDDF